MEKILKTFIAVPLALTAIVFVHTLAEAGKIRPETTINFKLVQLRTPGEMEAADAAMQATGRMPEAQEVPFRPTMSIVDYKAAKAAAAESTATNSEDAESPNGPLAPPVFIGPDIEGANQTEAGGWRPPDTHGAVGIDHFAEVTNSHYDVYRKSDGVRVKSVSLASFFGYTAESLFDPQCSYDSAANRWIVAAEAFQESSTVQRQFVAVSQTNDPTGAFYIYNADVNYKNNSDFWDYPHLGVDKNAILITANIFAFGLIYAGTDLAVVDKNKLYNGQGVRAKLFTNLDGTLMPPIVLDQSDKTCLVAAVSSGNITLYTLTYPGGKPTLSKSNISVPAYSTPPDASQPGTSDKLDTLDRRFVNASTQNGNSLWQVHTINNGGRPTPKWYEFNISTNTVIQSGTVNATGSSHDWNASVAANTSNDAFMTWSSTDVELGTNAQVRFSGRRNTDTAGVIQSGSALFTSSTFYNPSSDNPERWGDYSAVTVDPTNSLRAWIVNEKINSTTVWGSRIGQIGY